MDTAFYKQAVTSRGLKYNYYFAPAQPSKPTLLFLHGFPSTSYDWHHQVAFFQPKGYGIVAPDMLGYGGTDKPESIEAYTPGLMAKDIIDVLDAEKIDKVVSISHDWGSRINSRLVNFYPERLTALAFLTVGYLAPFFDADTAKLLALRKQLLGYETSGYWSFFTEDGADKIIESHWDSFHSIVFPADPALWKTVIAPTGELKAWLLADNRTSIAPYLTEVDKAVQKEALLGGGFNGPLSWYKIVFSDSTREDDKTIPLERYDIQQPVFFGGCARDAVSPPALAQGSLAKYVKEGNLTSKVFDAGHWGFLSHAGEVNESLLAWVEKNQKTVET